MKLVIKIDEKDYQSLKDGHIPFNVLDVIMNGTIIPKGHGRIIDERQITEVCIQRTEEVHINGILIPPRIIIVGTNAPTIIKADTESEET